MNRPRAAVPARGPRASAPKPEDRRVRRTKQSLADALLVLMRQKGFESFTVEELITRANVGRSTFYTHYADKEDLLQDGLDRLRRGFEALQQQGRRGASEQPPGFAFSRELFAHVHAHADIFRAMAGKRSGAMVQRLFQRMLHGLVRAEMQLPGAAPRPASSEAEAAVTFVAGGLYGLLAWWIDDRLRLSIDEVDELFRRLAVPASRAAAAARAR
jgi:AcrR family transcriptional regulator